MTRTNFTRKTKRIIIERANGRCEGKGCGAVLKVGEGDVDHILPDALGGDTQAANGQLLCKVCHKAKTAKDVGRTRKADRARDKQSGAMAPKQKIQSAPFQTTRKKQRFNKTSLAPKQFYRDA